jgi:hypothetical protein
MKKLTKHLKKRDFDVALSYATEDEKFVKETAEHLQKKEIKVYFAPNATVDMWGKDMYAYLDDVYCNRAKFTVMFISKYYAKKLWTNHERQSAQERAFTENKEYILPVRFDDTKIPGIRSTTGYISLKKSTPLKLAELIAEKIGPVEKYNYFPRNIERFFQELKISNPKERERLTLSILYLHDSFSLMTEDERVVIGTATMNTCGAGYPDNIHLRLDYLARLIEKSEDDLVRLFGRINSLNFLTTIHDEDHSHDDEQVIAENRKIVTIKFHPYFIYKYKDKEYDGGNSTIALYGYYKCLIKGFCPNCRIAAFRRNDFSVLNSKTYSEKT